MRLFRPMPVVFTLINLWLLCGTTWKAESAIPRVNDVWYRSSSYSGSSQQDIHSIMTKLSMMTTYAREVWVNNFNDCDANDWREVRIGKVIRDGGEFTVRL